MSINYDLLAPDYQQYRIPDARIAARINHHIPPGSKVLNVGAGQGSYEPAYCNVTAIEPSREMISRRPPASAPAIEGCAENLPFEDNSFDIALAILTIHHWLDVQKGVRELARVARSKVVILTWNGNYGDFWLPDYIPQIVTADTGLFPTTDRLSEWLGGAISEEIVSIPHDCTDGMMCAYWRRPEMYLNATARLAISTFSKLGDTGAELDCLRSDIISGRWHQKYQALLGRQSLECGYTLITHDRNQLE